MFDDFYDDEPFIYKVIQKKKDDGQEEQTLSKIPDAEYYFWYKLETSPIHNSLFITTSSFMKENEKEDDDDIFNPTTLNTLQEPYFLPEQSSTLSTISSYKMLNLKENTLYEFFTHLPPHLIDSKFVNIFFHLLKGFQLLQTNNLLHMHVQESSIVVDLHTHNSYITNFEQCISNQSLSTISSKWLQIFSKINTDTFSYYPLEVIILSWGVRQIFPETPSVHFKEIYEKNIHETTIEKLEKICMDYFQQTPFYSFFSKDKVQNIQKIWKHRIRKYLHKPWKLLFYNLTQKSLSWDMFAFYSMFLCYAEIFILHPVVKKSFIESVKEKIISYHK